MPHCDQPRPPKRNADLLDFIRLDLTKTEMQS